MKSIGQQCAVLDNMKGNQPLNNTCTHLQGCYLRAHNNGIIMPDSRQACPVSMHRQQQRRSNSLQLAARRVELQASQQIAQMSVKYNVSARWLEKTTAVLHIA
jgi:hypothetical protein